MGEIKLLCAIIAASVSARLFGEMIQLIGSAALILSGGGGRAPLYPGADVLAGCDGHGGDGVDIDRLGRRERL